MEQLQLVLRVISSLFLVLVITRIFMIIAERIGREFGFGDMALKFGGKLRLYFRKEK